MSYSDSDSYVKISSIYIYDGIDIDGEFTVNNIDII